MPPRILHLSNSEDMAEWRRIRSIGGSAARVICKVDPWETPFGLFQYLTYQKNKSFVNSAMRRGLQYEKLAIDEVEFETGQTWERNITLIHGQYDFLRAQIDAWSQDHIGLLEVKIPNAEGVEQAKAGIIPEYYIPQLDHELLVSDESEKVGYCVYDLEAGVFHIIWHYRDDKRLKKLLEAELEFWERTKTGTPPELTDKDYIYREDSEWVEAASNFAKLDAIIRDTKDQYEESKQRLLQLAGGHSTKGAGVKVLSYGRKKSISWKNAAEDLADIIGEPIDFEKYRESGTTIVNKVEVL